MGGRQNAAAVVRALAWLESRLADPTKPARPLLLTRLTAAGEMMIKLTETKQRGRYDGRPTVMRQQLYFVRHAGLLDSVAADVAGPQMSDGNLRLHCMRRVYGLHGERHAG